MKLNRFWAASFASCGFDLRGRGRAVGRGGVVGRTGLAGESGAPVGESAGECMSIGGGEGAPEVDVLMPGKAPGKCGTVDWRAGVIVGEGLRPRQTGEYIEHTRRGSGVGRWSHGEIRHVHRWAAIKVVWTGKMTSRPEKNWGCLEWEDGGLTVPKSREGHVGWCNHTDVIL
jgi:hypothetical protein